MTNNTDPVRAREILARVIAAEESKGYAARFGDEQRHVPECLALDAIAEALASAPPSAPVGVEGLQRRLDQEESDHGRTIDQRDAAEDALGRMFQAVTGRPAEWSSAWGYVDAIEEVEEHVAALSQQPAAPQLDAVKVPQPRPDYPNGVLTIQAARDAFPRSHPMFAALDQAASDLAVLDARDRRRKQPAAPSGEAVAYRWRDRGTMQMVYSSTHPGYCNVEPLYTAPQQPAAVDEDAAEALRFLLKRIGSWTNARWDQHLRHEFGDDRAGRMITALAAQQQGGRADG